MESKKIILSILLSIPLIGYSQDKFTVIPKARLEYVTSSTGHTMTVDRLVKGTTKTEIWGHDGILNQYDTKDWEYEPTIHLGRWRTDLGIEFAYKGVSFLFDTQVHMSGRYRGVKNFAFRPVQSNFQFTLQYQNKILPGVKVYIQHDCYHPIKYSTDKAETMKFSGYYGGATKIGISYNY